MISKKIIVIGGGPAGIMAAIRARQLDSQVTLIDKNPTLGRKLLLTGKGRCNLTNDCELDKFLERFSKKKGQFLRDAFKTLFNEELINFFQKRGLKFKVERQKRVFPITDKSSSVLEVLKKELKKGKVRLFHRSCAQAILTDKENRAIGIVIDAGAKLLADKVILATGGLSYGFTGSTGQGLEMARKLGHKIVDTHPGLVPLETKQNFTKRLSGVALKNIRLKFGDGKKEILSSMGELLFTDFGISGPLVLSFSGMIVDWLEEKKKVFVEIDFKPALSLKQLDERFIRDFKLSPAKSIKSILKSFLPESLIDVFVRLAEIVPDKIANKITKEEREKLVTLLKGLRLDIKSSLSMQKAMITRGGVSLKDINPRTMESRLIKGLYFAGEIIDVDGDTGGFNLQAAFSTGYLAGQSAAQ